MKKRYKILLAVLAAALCGAGAAFYLLQPLHVEPETVIKGPLAEQITEQGAVAPEERYTLTANMSGTVKKILYNEGETVGAGEPLLEIDTSIVKGELESQIASLKLQQSAIYSNNSGTQAELALRREQLGQQILAARREYERLYGAEGVAESLEYIAWLNYSQARRAYKEADTYYDDFEYDSDNKYTAGKSELSALRGQMNGAQESLVMAENNSSESTKAYYSEVIASCEAQLNALGKSDGYASNGAYAAAQQLQLTMGVLQEKLERPPVTTPQGGVVWSLLVEEGGFIAENQPIASLYTPEGMCVEAKMLAEDALAINVGDTAECRLADGTVLSAAVSFISPVAQEVVSTIGLSESRCTVKLELESLPDGIGAGHQVKLTFSIPVAEDAVSVSAGSIVPNEEGSAVYVIRGGKAVLQPVETGAQRGGRVEILAGLAEGDTIVGDPYDSKITDGKKVAL